MEGDITKKKIYKVGNQIRSILLKNETPTKEQLDVLKKWRKSYKEALNTVNRELNSIMNRIDNQGIITYRIKRIESIFSKLRRYPKMNLARMHDIAGARCIVSNEQKTNRLLDEIYQSKIIKVLDTDNYIESPKESGYKSIHLRCSCCGKNIEIQLRDETQHSWATLVEIADVVYRTEIKEYADDKGTGLCEFLKILSKSKNLTKDEREKLNSILIKTRFLQKLTKVFSKNSHSLIKTWTKNAIQGPFYLFEVDEKNTASIKTFSSFDEAEDQYFALSDSELSNASKKNYVMAYISNSDYEMVTKAYSNYVLTRHNFYRNLSNILKNDTGDISVNNKSFYLLFLCSNCQIAIRIGELKYSLNNPNSSRNKQHIISIKEEIKKIKKNFGVQYRVRFKAQKRLYYLIRFSIKIVRKKIIN